MVGKFVPVVDSKQSAAFYRKVLLAYLIDSQASVNLKVLEQKTGWPKRTIQDSLREIKTISVSVSFHGSAKSGHYKVDSWGVLDKDKVYTSITAIESSLNQYLTHK
ncbi:helix-turn-helix domain-containing protein [Vibrio ostreicida]|uniref:helix-turn-helix domain-containing protein n=1 Tax=Vibrio ostreicida TaxID=526588 RepID=UPI003B5BF84E